MMDINLKTIGYALAGISIILLITLTFIKIDVDERDLFLCQQFHENNLDMADCPAHTSNISWVITVAFGLSFLMLGLGIYILVFSKQVLKDSKQFKEVDLSKLDDEEKQVYAFVKSKEGSTYQSDLVKETGFSKVKMSRILDKLETKGILERRRRGMANLVILK